MGIVFKVVVDLGRRGKKLGSKSGGCTECSMP